MCIWGGGETRSRAQDRALRYLSEKRGSTLLKNSTKPSREVVVMVKSSLDTRVLTRPSCSPLRSPGPSCSAHIGADATATLCIHNRPSSRGTERTEGLSADPTPALGLSRHPPLGVCRGGASPHPVRLSWARVSKAGGDSRCRVLALRLPSKQAPEEIMG